AGVQYTVTIDEYQIVARSGNNCAIKRLIFLPAFVFLRKVYDRHAAAFVPAKKFTHLGTISIFGNNYLVWLNGLVAQTFKHRVKKRRVPVYRNDQADFHKDLHW